MGMGKYAAMNMDYYYYTAETTSVFPPRACFFPRTRLTRFRDRKSSINTIVLLRLGLKIAICKRLFFSFVNCKFQ